MPNTVLVEVILSIVFDSILMVTSMCATNSFKLKERKEYASIRRRWIELGVDKRMRCKDEETNEEGST